MAEYQRQMQLQIPSPAQLFTPAVTIVLMLLILGYAFTVYMPEFMTSIFGLTKAGLSGGKVWQLVTYPFLNGMCGLVFNGAIILFFGSAIERVWRTRSFAVLWLVVSGVCGMIWMLASVILGQNFLGAGVGVNAYGIIAVFGILFYRQRILLLFWPVEAQFISWLLIGIGLIGCISSPLNLIWVGGALVAYFYVKMRWAISQKRFSASHSISSGRSFVDLD